MRIRPVDVGADDELARFHAVDSAAHRVGRPYATVWTLPEFTVTVRSPSQSSNRLLVVAEQDGDVVGAGQLELHLSDNTHLAELRVSVHPDHRRRGIGTALAGHLRGEAEAAGRRLASAWIAGRQLWPGAPADEPGADQFARRCGLTLRNTDVHRVLELPVDPAVLDRLAADAAPHHQDYEIFGFTGACPDDYVDAYCRLKAAMITEAPLGDVEMEPEKWDESRLREEEADLAGMRRTRFSVFALASDGQVAGFNELLHAAHDIGNAYNWDTLVLPAHRGHRLGMALKVANLRRFQSAFPDVRRVHTHNAAQNAPMIAVNDAVGFVPVEQVGEWQGPVTDLPAAPA